jgi:hypothetical protein
MNDQEWVTMIRKLPREMLPVVLGAEKAAADILRFCGKLPLSPASQAVELTEMVYAAALISFTSEDSYQRLMMDADRHERAEALEAMDRDGWRCLICHHSGMNKAPGGQLQSHHCVPRGVWDERVRPPDIHHRSNKATLCQSCHEKITNPRSPHWHWRNIAPSLLRTIGNPELAARVEATCSDPLLDLVADEIR